MTKKKKDSPKETKVRNKVLNGRVTKVKNSELAPVTPFTRKIQEKATEGRLGPRKAEKSSSKISAAMPFPSGNMSKCTSTPMTGRPKHVSRSGRVAKPNLKFAQFFGSFAVKTLPSPILADIGNRNTNRAREIAKNKKLSTTETKKNGKQSNVSKENAKRTRTESNKTAKSFPDPKRVKVSNENRPRSISSSQSSEMCYADRRNSSVRVLVPRSPTIKNMLSKDSNQDPFLSTITHRRRRSVGMRKVETNGSKEKGNNLRVRVPRSPSIREMLAANKTANSISTRLNKTGDNSMVKRLQADWSSSSFEQTPSKFTEDTMVNAFQKYTPLRAGKRRLSPLIEITCCEDSVCSGKPLRTSRINVDEEDGYSSSAEFENDNEAEKNRSKRAPTWKDLLNKTVESVSCLKISSPEKDVPQRRSQAEQSALNRTGENGRKNIKPPPDESKVVDSPRERQNQSNETVTENPVSPSSRSQNLLNNSEIEQILSSSNNNDDVENIPTNFSTANSTTTKKFFHSRQEKSIVDPKPLKEPKTTRKSGRKRKQDSVYEFLSQSSSDDVDPIADVIQKMIKTGKVTVAKLKKGTGKMVLPQQKRRKLTKKITSQIESNVQPKPLTKRHPLKETNVVTFNDQPQYEDDGFFDDEPRGDQGGFSELARSAMIKQASKSHQTPQRKPIPNKGELLAMVQKIVGQSTPNITFLAPANTSQFSPILGSSSPWRVDDDSLPKAFYFSRNSDNLPSFSSDHIPSTPVKNKSKSKSLSSFSSNDSNMENMPPPSIQVAANENQTQNTLNARRALSYRSPLKNINIIDVVHLPPLTMNKVANKSANNTSNNIANNTANNMSNNTSNKTVNNTANNTAHKTANKTSQENTTKDKSSKSTDFGLFGFDEDMSDTEDDNVDVTETVSRKQYLKAEMLRLRTLRPQIPPTTTAKKNNHRIKPVFDDERRRQLTMKQLCSTMIEKRQSDLAYDNSQDENMNSPGDLFKDSRPETTFNQEQPRRSYSRRHGKSHRNYFIDYPSEDEDDEVYKVKAKKRQRRDPKEEERKAELNRFADEFNKMCQEVSEYEIMVE